MNLLKKTTEAVLTLTMACILSLLPEVSTLAAVGPGGAISTGVDVSVYNGTVNWQAAANAGVRFTFIKVGSTKSGMDPQFLPNIQNAGNAGIRTGVYLYSYAVNVEQAVQEAQLVLGWIDGQTVTYPVVYDIEDAVHRGKSPTELAAMANAFCEVIDAAGYYPMVYSSKNWFEGRIGTVNYDKWVAQYNEVCEYNGAVSFWQSTSHATISGFNGRVDFNYQYKDYSNLIIPEGFLERNGAVRFYRNWRMQKGWVDYGDARYYLNEAGQLQKGIWFTEPSGNTYYLTPEDGRMARGQYPVGGQDFYFTAEGVKTIGWVTLGEQSFFYDPATDGVMKREWYSDEAGRFFYFDKADGHMLTGAVTLDQKHYFFGEDGVRFAGIRALPEGAWYYDPGTGEMRFGWIQTEDKTYYANQAGNLVVGLNNIDGKEYYFDASGELQRNQVIDIGGIPYILDEQGAAVVQPAPEPAPAEETGIVNVSPL